MPAKTGQRGKTTATDVLMSASLLAKRSEYQFVATEPMTKPAAANTTVPAIIKSARFMASPTLTG